MRSDIGFKVNKLLLCLSAISQAGGDGTCAHLCSAAFGVAGCFVVGTLLFGCLTSSTPVDVELAQPIFAYFSVAPSLGRSATEMLLHVISYNEQYGELCLRQRHTSKACINAFPWQEGCLQLLQHKPM